MRWPPPLQVRALRAACSAALLCPSPALQRVHPPRPHLHAAAARRAAPADAAKRPRLSAGRDELLAPAARAQLRPDLPAATPGPAQWASPTVTPARPAQTTPPAAGAPQPLLGGCALPARRQSVCWLSIDSASPALHAVQVVQQLSSRNSKPAATTACRRAPDPVRAPAGAAAAPCAAPEHHSHAACEDTGAAAGGGPARLLRPAQLHAPGGGPGRRAGGDGQPGQHLLPQRSAAGEWHLPPSHFTFSFTSPLPAMSHLRVMPIVKAG